MGTSSSSSSAAAAARTRSLDCAAASVRTASTVASGSEKRRMRSDAKSPCTAIGRAIVDDDIKRPRRTPGVLAVVPLATESAQCAKTGRGSSNSEPQEYSRVFVTFADEKSYVSEE